MSPSTKSVLKILSVSAFTASVYWVFSTIKINPFSAEPEPVIALITSLIALIIAIYQKDSDESAKPMGDKNNIATVSGNNNTVLQDVQNTHFNSVTQNHFGSGDNVTGDKIQK